MREVLSVVSGILFFGACLPYIVAIIRKKTEPKKATWLIWAIMDTVIFAGMYAKGVTNGQIIAAVLSGWIIAALALKYGIPGWSKTEKRCLGGTVLGIVLWAMFKNPLLGIVIICIVGLLGSVPTFQSALENPEKEDRLAWTIWWISCVVAVLAIPHWTLADAAQPLAFATIESIMMYLLWIRPRRFRNQKPAAS